MSPKRPARTRLRSKPVELGTEGRPALWYTETTSTLDVKDIRHDWRGVIVSRNSPIVLSVDLRGGTFYSPTTPPAGTPANIVVVSGYGHATQPCDQFSISRPGNTGTWEGTWWAPLGQVRIAGEGTIINRGIVAHGIQMEGNRHVISAGAGGTPGAGGSRIVILQ